MARAKTTKKAAASKTDKPKKRRGSAPVVEPKMNGVERPKKPRPMDLPGVIVRVKELDDAAYEYVEARDTRMAATVEEVKHKEKLLELMKKHQQQIYRLDDDQVVEVVHESETVKVRKAPIDKPVKTKDAEAH